MAIYIHIPFCEQLCYFCFCYTKITSNKELINKTFENILAEIRLYKKILDGYGIKPRVRQIQIGGGTPTYLTHEQFKNLLYNLNQLSPLDEVEELAIEIDPRTVTESDMEFYYQEGVNRISMGIQDFEETVQKAINRIQPYDMVKRLVDTHKGRCSLNFDLIYGLPEQTEESFSKTVDLACSLSPDRLSVYCYDHTPQIYNHHKLMDKYTLPSSDRKIKMFLNCASILKTSGYNWIGVDHFAKNDDSLCVAKKTKRLGRTLNGYSTFRSFDFELGIGPSAISSLSSLYLHNVKDLNKYAEKISKNLIPIFRYWRLSDDDLKRKWVIMQIINYGFLEYLEFEKKFNVKFLNYFSSELTNLKKLAKDNFIKIDSSGFKATQLGRYFIYQVAKAFDLYNKDNSKYVRTHEAIKMVKMREKS